MTVVGGLQKLRLHSASQASRRCRWQPRSQALLQRHSAVSSRPCMRRLAMMEADNETVAEEAAGEIGKLETQCMHGVDLAISCAKNLSQ